jgi:hypothetical protein
MVAVSYSKPHGFVAAYLGKLIAKLRKEIAVRTDERMRLMDEIVSGIQVIKMYAWEKPFAKLVQVARRYVIRNETGPAICAFLISSCITYLLYITSSDKGVYLL